MTNWKVDYFPVFPSSHSGLKITRLNTFIRIKELKQIYTVYLYIVHCIKGYIKRNIGGT